MIILILKGIKINKNNIIFFKTIILPQEIKVSKKNIII